MGCNNHREWFDWLLSNYDFIYVSVLMPETLSIQQFKFSLFVINGIKRTWVKKYWLYLLYDTISNVLLIICLKLFETCPYII